MLFKAAYRMRNTTVDCLFLTAGFLDDDVIIGDPLFTVPLYDQNGTTSRPSSLCYEIHGSTGRTFNLVSDRCTSVNALYSALSVPENGNIISAIGVRAVNRLGRCIDIRVDLNNSCMPTISDGKADIASYPGLPRTHTKINTLQKAVYFFLCVRGRPGYEVKVDTVVR